MSDPEISSRLLRYGLAVVSVAIALGLALLAQVYAVHNPEFPLFLIAIAVTVWYAGAWPGVLAVVLSSASFNYFFFTEPLYTFYIAPSDRLLRSMDWRCCSRLNLMRK
jgi:K+-sensing histidine kinase KdpD